MMSPTGFSIRFGGSSTIPIYTAVFGVDRGMPPEELKEMIRMLSNLSDDSLETSLSKACREYDGNNPALFLHNLRDMAVFIGGASDKVMLILGIVLDQHPESEQDRDRRRALLEKDMSNWARMAL